MREEKGRSGWRRMRRRKGTKEKQETRVLGMSRLRIVAPNLKRFGYVSRS